MSKVYDVVIVGAGICGLTAAVELSKNKAISILVLEADDRPGGRAKSVALDNGLIVDTGAHWFHGGNDNPFYQWAKERYDLGEVVLDTTENTLTFWHRGDAEYLQKITERLEKEYRGHDCAYDLSLHDLAVRMNDPAATDVINYVTSEWMAVDDPKDARATELFDDPLGYDGWQIIGGTGKLTAMMESEARSRGIEFLYKAKIDGVRNDASMVQITYGDDKVVVAKQCLVTVSCVILKQKDILFPPEIQARIDEKVAYLHMGNLAKITVPLKKSFFEENFIKPDTSYDLIDKNLYIHAYSGGTPSLTIFVGGKRSVEIEAMDENCVEQFIYSVLSGIESLKNYQTFRDGNFFKSIWRGNSLAKGSYAIGLPGRGRSDPFVAGKIVFAGKLLSPM